MARQGQFIAKLRGRNSTLCDSTYPHLWRQRLRIGEDVAEAKLTAQVPRHLLLSAHPIYYYIDEDVAEAKLTAQVPTHLFCASPQLSKSD